MYYLSLGVCVYIYIYIYITHRHVCVVYIALWKIGSRSIGRRAGEQSLLLDCRAAKATPNPPTNIVPTNIA